METVMTSCKECDGTGMVTSMEPQPLKGCKLTSSHRLAAQNRKCEHCRWGRVRVEVEAGGRNLASAISITFNGIEVTAPGCSQDQFDRAMVRAFVDDLEVTETDTPDRYVVGHRNTGIGYHVTRERCGCKAGTAGTPCKHRAFLIAHLDIRHPAIAKQWQKLHTDRSARVAA